MIFFLLLTIENSKTEFIYFCLFFIYLSFIYILLFIRSNQQKTQHALRIEKNYVLLQLEKNGQKVPLKCKMGVIFRHFCFQSLFQE